ncbi:hypothetical protein MTsPCn9_02600 [Croceitalea sp. MTPC9]|uniref:DUF2141 domain-containing protein n=1 Tax=unclassified Croceitalea TaxID=2632280 RepID=UPI002B3D6CB4|nr:hypothetical protein MTsPCn6_06110 [Croceitalea sp. MTPC6]GMN15324.1 hypothetical protein MTsPCn9_02600 [Croceitalea sp. MTPC9]
MKQILASFLLLVLTSAMTLNAQSQDMGKIRVFVTEASNDKGNMIIGLYNSEKEWLEKVYVGMVSEIKNGKCEVLFEKIPYGNYAVSLFHDKNNNKKFDMFLGFMPKEDYGTSNDAKGNFGPPKWEDAKFTLSQEEKSITIKL